MVLVKLNHLCRSCLPHVNDNGSLTDFEPRWSRRTSPDRLAGRLQKRSLSGERQS